MAKPATFNKEGEIIMGAAAYHTKIFSVSELSHITGIPNSTLASKVSSNGGFGNTTIDCFRAIVKAAGMTDEEIVQVVKG